MTACARRLPCPYTGVPFRNVPGYIEGYGCPVCKSISVNGHLLLTRPVVVPPSLGVEEENYRTAIHKGKNGCGQAIRWHVEDRKVDKAQGVRYIDCPCGQRFVLACGSFEDLERRSASKR